MWSQELYREALLSAAHAHSGQKITGTNLPYIIHCVNVCNEVLHAALLRDDTDADLCVACSLLHDTLEDTEIPLSFLMEKFGEHVLSGICSLTKNKDLPKNERVADSLKRIKEQPEEIWMIKMADRIVNLGPPPENWTKDKRIDYNDEALVIYEALKDADPNLAARLLQKIEQYKVYTV